MQWFAIPSGAWPWTEWPVVACSDRLQSKAAAFGRQVFRRRGVDMQSGTNTINTAIFVDVAGVMAIACLDYAAEPLHSSAMCSASSHQPIDLDLAIAHREAGQ